MQMNIYTFLKKFCAQLIIISNDCTLKTPFQSLYLKKVLKKNCKAFLTKNISKFGLWRG